MGKASSLHWLNLFADLIENKSIWHERLHKYEKHGLKENLYVYT